MAQFRKWMKLEPPYLVKETWAGRDIYIRRPIRIFDNTGQELADRWVGQK